MTLMNKLKIKIHKSDMFQFVRHNR